MNNTYEDAIEGVKETLDNLIREWEQEIHKTQPIYKLETIHTSINVLQDLRERLFGEILPLEEMPYPCPAY